MSGTKANAAALYLNFIVLALLGFAINPLLVGYLGAGNFGLWKASLRILDFATVADGRATQALKWVVAFQDKNSESEKKQRDIGASLVMWLLWLPLLLIVVIAITYALPLAIGGIKESDVEIIRLVGAVLGANVVLTALLSVPDAVLVGTNQGYRSTGITTVFLVVSNVGMVVAAWLGCGLPSLAAIVLVSSILNGACTWAVARRHVSWWGVKKPERGDVRQLASFSGWTLLGALLQMLFLSTELLLFSALLGAIAVTNYTFTSYILQFALSICLMTGSAVTPKLGALLGNGETVAARTLIARTREIVLAVIAISGSAVLLFNREFVSIWAGPSYYMGDDVNALMVAAFLQLALIRCDGQIQDVCLQIRQKVLIGLFGGALGLILGAGTYMMTSNVVSMYCGILTGRLIISVAFPQLVSQMVAGSRYSVGRIAITIMVVMLCYLISPYVRVSGWVELIVSAAIAGVLLSAIAYTTILSVETRSAMFRMPRR